MRSFLLLAATLLLSGCTVSHGMVKDVYQDARGNLTMHKCDLNVYLAFYGLIAAEDNCHDEPVTSTPATQARRAGGSNPARVSINQ